MNFSLLLAAICLPAALAAELRLCQKNQLQICRVQTDDEIFDVDRCYRSNFNTEITASYKVDGGCCLFYSKFDCRRECRPQARSAAC